MKKCERCGRNRRFIMCICGYMPMSKKTRIFFIIFNIIISILAIGYMSHKQQEEALKNCTEQSLTSSCSSEKEIKPSQNK